MFYPTSFFWHQIQIDRFEFDWKDSRRAEHEYLNTHTSAINVLATVLHMQWTI